MVNEEPEYWTTAHAARVAGMEVHTITIYCGRGIIPAINKYGRWLIRPDDLWFFLRNRRGRGRPPGPKKN